MTMRATHASTLVRPCRALLGLLTIMFGLRVRRIR
jgi:hypothetical protein